MRTDKFPEESTKTVRLGWWWWDRGGRGAWLRQLGDLSGTREQDFGSRLSFLCCWIHIPFKCLCGEFHSTETIQTMHDTLTKQSSRKSKIKVLVRPGQLTRAMPPAFPGSKSRLHYCRKHLWRSMRGWPRTFYLRVVRALPHNFLQPTFHPCIQILPPPCSLLGALTRNKHLLFWVPNAPMQTL